MHERAQAEALKGVGVEARGSVVLDEKFESGVAPVDPRPESEILAEVRRVRGERNRAIRDARLGRTPSTLPVANVVPIGTVCRARSSRGKTTRTRGSRRSTASSRAGPSDDPGEPEPGPESGQLYLAHPSFGKVSRALAHHLRRLGL